MIVAGIDIGTLTCRLLVADVEPGGALTFLAADRRILRLGEGVATTKRLSGSAIARVVDTLCEWKAQLSQRRVSTTLVVATSAVREAHNRREFVEAVKRKTGFDVEVVDGAKEAEYTLRGIQAGLPRGVEDFVGLDIGGGSTELMRPGSDKPCVRSIDVGVVRLTERFLLADPPTDEMLRAIEDVVRNELLAIGPDFHRASNTMLVGTAGTVTTLAAMIQRLPRYDPAKIHQFVLERPMIREMEWRLRTRDRRARRSLPGLEPGREDVIVAGTILLRVTMEVLGFDRCIVSEYGLREGIVCEAARRIR